MVYTEHGTFKLQPSVRAARVASSLSLGISGALRQGAAVLLVATGGARAEEAAGEGPGRAGRPRRASGSLPESVL